MGFEFAQIILNHPNGKYCAGEIIYGRIVFSKTKSKSISDFYVKFKCFCKVSWTERTNNDTNIIRSSYEEYFNRVTPILRGEHVLQPGLHDFEFKIQIPVNSPSTYESNYGHIRYRIKAVMKASGTFSPDREKSILIKVHTPINLNDIPYCLGPLKYELVNAYSCCCMSQGMSQVRVTLPARGFCPGQVIPVTINVNNPSRVYINEVKLSLRKHLVYIAKNNSGKKKKEYIIAEMRKGPISTRCSRNWDLNMRIPSIEVYNLDMCNYIHIKYELKVTVDVSGCHEGNTETKPIIIGTVPLVNFYNQQTNEPTQLMVATSLVDQPVTDQPRLNQPVDVNNIGFVASNGVGDNSIELNDIPSDPPPSYEDVMAQSTTKPNSQ